MQRGRHGPHVKGNQEERSSAKVKTPLPGKAQGMLGQEIAGLGFVVFFLLVELHCSCLRGRKRQAN